MAFVGALAGSGLAHEVLCRQGLEGGWWVQADHALSDLSHLIWTAGGRPYARDDDQNWRSFAIDDSGADAGLQPDTWPQVELAQLLAATGLRRRQFVPAPELFLLTIPALSRWVLKRALPLGVRVGLRSARACPLGAAEPERHLLLLRLSAERGLIPRALAKSLSTLPYTVLAQSVGPLDAQLLVDVRYAAPLAESLLAELLPEGETWILSGPDCGHHALTLEGEEIDAATLLDVPSLQQVPLVAQAEKAELPAPLPVTLVGRRGSGRRVDAVLLDSDELAWTRSLLIGRPLSESAFLIPGAGRHLLLAEGGLGSAIPFGLPLEAAAPGGLFIEAGLGFRPALPAEARRQALELDAERVLVLTEQGAWRFQLDHLLPVWALWVGEAPPIRDDLDQHGRNLLAKLDQDQRRRETARQSAAQRMLNNLRGRLGGGREASPDEIRREAIAAQNAGDLLRAAELRAAVGDLGQAGRLYEQIARGL